jgi:hypothetical protein
MGTTLLMGLGTARSFLLLFFYVVALFGVPLALLALRLAEIIAEHRYNRKAEMARERERELTGLGETISTSEPDVAAHIISTRDMKNA